MSLLNVQNIETYYGLIYALRGVSFEIQEGTITTILGNNGAGKSTILNSIIGLIDDQPEKGLIEFDGETITGLKTERIVKMGIGYVPEGREIFNELTVLENIQMGAYTRNDKAGINQDIERMFSYFPVLKERAKQLGGTLSGGEQQMLAIARALMGRPKLLMLDEPSLGLSPLLVKEMFRIIRQIHQDGTTILLVEQNAKMALELADYGLVLENGRFVASGTSAELQQDDDVKEFYLGVKSQISVKGYQRYRRKKKWR
jgi:branched-chain amino acid transport system ATP-binding protein